MDLNLFSLDTLDVMHKDICKQITMTIDDLMSNPADDEIILGLADLVKTRQAIEATIKELQ
jgi:hypothetical protein